MFGTRMPYQMETGLGIVDDEEEVVNSMRRYGSHNNRFTDDGQLEQARDLLTQPLSITPASDNNAPGDTSTSFASQPIDLEPIIAAMSTLLATSHTQSTDILTSMIDQNTSKAMEREKISEQKQLRILLQIQETKAAMAQDWDDMMRQDAVRESQLKVMMENVSEPATWICLLLL
jgi:hypothetical protein